MTHTTLALKNPSTLNLSRHLGRLLAGQRPPAVYPTKTLQLRQPGHRPPPRLQNLQMRQAFFEAALP